MLFSFAFLSIFFRSPVFMAHQEDKKRCAMHCVCKKNDPGSHPFLFIYPLFCIETFVLLLYLLFFATRFRKNKSTTYIEDVRSQKKDEANIKREMDPNIVLGTRK